VDVGLRAIVGAEALVRWRHPSRGLVSPGDFIEIAEETGMIMPIGEWVMRAACADAVRWNLPAHAAFRVAVNVSSRQLHQHGFSQEVACILAETGLDPGRLEIEITETSALGASEATRSTLASLRKLGVTVAIDDFGTGYSSLTLLKELPLDSLKIDQSFVRGSEQPGRHEVIVAGLIRMAQGLGIATVAEGVETREQLQSLYAKGCHRMQGYLFGKPIPAPDFARLLSGEDTAYEAEIEAAGLDL
jgi:EAL domain-containing protein (putative c-di-GMP-specific phosphodiesterase class I)